MRHVPWLVAIAVMLAACGQSAPPLPVASSAAPASAAAASAPVSTTSASASASAPSKPQPSATPSASAAASGKPAAGASIRPSPQTRGGDPNGYPIRVAYASPAVASWPFYGAFAAGLFTQQHLAVSMMQMAPNVAIIALSKGEIDFTNAPGNALEGASRGLPFKVVLSSWSRSPWTIVGKAGLKSVQDLRGKTVGTNQAGSTPYLYLEAALKKAGMSMSDIQVVSSPGTQDTFTLLLGGKLDAAVVSPPFDVQSELHGFHEVAFIGDALQQPYIGLGTTTTFLTQHRPQVVGMIKALMDANGWLKAHPAEAADLIVKNLGVEPEVAKRSAAKMLPLLSDTGEMPLSAVEENNAIQAELTHKPIKVKPEDMVDWGPLHEALGKA